MAMSGAELQYMRQQIADGLRDILEAQRLIAAERIYQKGHDRVIEKRGGLPVSGRSGDLMEALTNPRYGVSVSRNGVVGETSLPTYIRFLDMKKHGNFQIYNRQVWGILYKETYNKIKFEYREWLENNFRNMLNELSNNLK